MSDIVDKLAAKMVGAAARPVERRASYTWSLPAGGEVFVNLPLRLAEADIAEVETLFAFIIRQQRRTRPKGAASV